MPVSSHGTLPNSATNSSRSETSSAVLQEMIAFLYRMEPDRFESIVEKGARLGVERFAPEHEVGDVSIPTLKQGGNLKQARRKMDDDDPLTDREIRVMLSDGEISPDELKAHVRSNPSPEVNEWGRRFR